MLRTGFFALFAPDTVAGFSVPEADIVIVNRMAGKASRRPGNTVVQRESSNTQKTCSFHTNPSTTNSK